MVGWIPPFLDDRIERLREFSLRVQESQKVKDNETAFILHYDSKAGDLRPFFWPRDKHGRKYKPSALNALRLSHFFLSPCCYCAWIDGKRYTEAKIGLALAVHKTSGADCLGEYIAICAEQKCGFFVVLDAFYAKDKLLTREYCKREEPLKTLDPFHFVTGDTEATAQRAGLRQVQILRDDASSSLRGSRMLLRREDPEKFFEFERSTEKLLKSGLPSEKFWDMFVQCTSCNFVMLRHYFPYTHPCTVSIVEANLAASAHRKILKRRLTEHEHESEDEELDTRNAERSPTPELGSDDSLPQLKFW